MALGREGDQTVFVCYDTWPGSRGYSTLVRFDLWYLLGLNLLPSLDQLTGSRARDLFAF